jgi:hypothetical protein
MTGVSSWSVLLSGLLLPGLRSPRDIFVHPSALHHEYRAAGGADVLERVAVEADDIRLHARQKGPDFIAQV